MRTLNFTLEIPIDFPQCKVKEEILFWSQKKQESIKDIKLSAALCSKDDIDFEKSFNIGVDFPLTNTLMGVELFCGALKWDSDFPFYNCVVQVTLT